MSHTLRVVHHHPGRLRVRSDVLCGVNEQLACVRAALGGIEGVHSVAHNPASGSVRVDYEPGAVDPNALVEAAARAAGLALPHPEEEMRARAQRVASVAIGAARDLNAFAHELTGGRADLRDLVPMAMTGLAAYSFIVKKERMPRWDNLAYWAFSIFSSFHTSEIAADRDRVP